MILIGTSGWQYADWRGRFYPDDVPQRSWLRSYASRFPTVEVNATFYRLPRASTFARWREETPDRFVMAVKASRFITHVRRLRDPEEPVRTLLERASALGDRLGPILFQLPPRFPVDPRSLKGVLDVLPQGVRAAFEFRDHSWFDDRIYELLREGSAALVIADRAGTSSPQVVTTDWTYVRFHQGTALDPGYPRAALRRSAAWLTGLPVQDAYVYFNNDTGGAAIRDASAFASLLPNDTTVALG